MISGDNQYPGGVDLLPTDDPFPVDAENLSTQLEAAQIPWRSYQESMVDPCRLASGGQYVPRHDPFLYFSNIQLDAALCADRNVDYSQFAADLAAGTYRYMWITPNQTSNGHTPHDQPVVALQNSDAWLAENVPAILASAAFRDGGVLFLTWDEAEGHDGHDDEHIPMIVISPLVTPGFTTDVAYTHSSYLATVEDLLGLPRLATVTDTPSMLEFFPGSGAGAP